MSIDPQNVELAERQNRLPLDIVEAFKAGVAWCEANPGWLPSEIDIAAKHFAITGETD